MTKRQLAILSIILCLVFSGLEIDNLKFDNSAYSEEIVTVWTTKLNENIDTINRVSPVDVKAFSSKELTSSTINAAILEISKNERTLLLSPGDWSITTDLTVPSNINLRIERGAKLIVSSGVTVTIKGGFEAPLAHVITLIGTGKVDLNTAKIQEIYPQWFGAQGDGTTDDTIAIQAAIDSGAKTIFFPASTYLCNINIKGTIVLKGEGINSTILRGYNNTAVIANNNGMIDSAFVNILNIRVEAHKSHTGFAIDLQGSGVAPFTGMRYGCLDNVYVVSSFGKGIKIERCWVVELNKVRTSTYKTALEILNGCNAINIVNSALIGSKDLSAASLKDAVVRIYGSPIEHSSINFRGTTFEDGRAEAIYARNIKGITVDGCYFENDATTVATEEIRIENCPSARFVGNYVRMRNGVKDFVFDNTNLTSKIFREGKITISGNVFLSTTHTMGAFSSDGLTSSQTSAIIDNNSSDWMMFGSRHASLGAVPHQRYDQYMLDMPQHNARYTSPGSSATMPVSYLLDGWYVKKAEWVVDASYTNGSPNILYFEKRCVNTFTVNVSTDTGTLVTVSSPYYQTGYKVFLSTTGTLPAGLSTTYYYVIPTGANTFKLATSLVNAQKEISVDITDTGRGTHTATIIGLISTGATRIPINATAGDRIEIKLLSDGSVPSYKTGILSQGEYLYGYSEGGGTVNEYGHFEVTLYRFSSL